MARSRTISKTPFWKAIGFLVALAGVLVAANQLEEVRLENDRRGGSEAFFQLLDQLGSDSSVVRVGAIGQIPGIVSRAVPVKRQQHALEGLLFLFGLHSHPVDRPYHVGGLRMIESLVKSSKPPGEQGEQESAAILQMLCDLGREGWYLGSVNAQPSPIELCLAWVWQNAPRQRIVHRPSWNLFRGAAFSGTDFSKYHVMARANFAEARLTDVSFQSAQLTGCTFRNSHLVRVSFEGASLHGCDFRGATFEDVVLQGADVAGADFAGATLGGRALQSARNINMSKGISPQE